jgi:hypothetical protein
MSTLARILALRVFAPLTVLVCAAASASAQDAQVGGPLPGPFPLFPTTNWWNSDISQAPADPNSATFIDFINANGRRRLHPDMGGNTGLSAPDPLTYGMIYTVVPGSQPLVPVTFQYDDESDHAAPGRPPGYPIPDQAKTEPRWIEGGLPGGGTNGDRHMLLVDRDNRLLYELFALRWNATAGRWDAGSGAIFPLDTNLRRPDTWTSADAAGLAILPGLIRYDEAFGSDPIRHALRVTVRATNGYVFPASHRAGNTAGALPMGARLRLRANKDLSTYPAHLGRVFQAMKTYGLIVADNGSDMYITGTYDTRWDMSPILSAFRSLYADDFEVISLGWNPVLTDGDSDGLSDEWEDQSCLDKASAAGVNGAGGDPDGDGASNLDEFRAGTHPRGTRVTYFAEGVTRTFFSTRFALVNPGTSAARVLCRFLKSDGSTVTHWVTVPPLARRTVEAASVPNLASAEFSTTIESDALIGADRTVAWDTTRYGAHTESGIPSPSSIWHFAEGATHSGFDLFYLFQNPATTTSTVRVTYLRPSPLSPLQRTYSVAPLSRITVWVDTVAPELAAVDVSATVEVLSGPAIIAERAMYLGAGGRTFGAGHASAAARAPTQNWFLAEGATGDYFDLFVLIANPGSQAASVRAQYLLPSGQVVTKSYVVEPRSRFNVWVDREDTRLADTSVSTVITSTNGVPVVVERAMWWPGPSGVGWREAHASAGSTQPALDWLVSDGEVGGAAVTSTYVLLANVGNAGLAVDVQVVFDDATPTVTRRYTLAANSRSNIDVGRDFPTTSGHRIGVITRSVGSPTPSLVVERSTYWDVGPERWAAGTNALGFVLR